MVLETRQGPEVGEILIAEDEIQRRVAELAAQITEDYRDKELTVLAILKGAVVFLADLIRLIPLQLRLDVITAASYGSSTRSSGQVHVEAGLDLEIRDKDVLLVDDIVDSGLTLERIRAEVQSHRPRTVRTCALLSKPSRRTAQVHVDYFGFEVPDQFVVGYGLDLDGRYRNLPYIAVVEEREVT